MLTKLERAVDAWGGSNTLIDNWLESRRQLLIHYCQLAGLPPYEGEKGHLPDETRVQQFCNLLVDYMSEGHFEVYDQVSTACEQSGEHAKALAQSLVPKISASTDAALDFNDKYTNGVNDDIMMELDQDLSELGQKMEERFELEDRLLEALFERHSEAS
ncbi:regulator of RpoD, Rsd/AlgQ [Ferrimonas balearica DSM 9799]|uniref:Regulator of RpoD, Rsd/AlgQ n=1 Tax=Ferrimonas balearica (strain DSM 9799 / CCM 4581 / KCTC 23876 / PAT) TaxID=550540 RepID=E1SN92_FERBD|nr:Rsd/AlgQ family anti-sigma factor [Ferrimonas balearica]ADN74591.1 regulator of RpoD, Rsd/AlgQ [Ferrimonas balearica DSM 9799]MBY6018572.1 Rsd/AlgQ family anti-sigma factor [Halomonas denitrificans]MBY6096477.1 Rsd/AlgQ family anti-sigma factor [Ferrimonas balearica]